MDTPQEIEVWFILPGLRREFVVALKRQGIAQKKIARLLNISEPAVSQYLSNKRGATTFNDALHKEIDASAGKIIAKKSDFRTELQKMLRIIKKTRFICGVCHEHLDTEDDCEVCYV
ncbi:TPA: hypothetical protein HA239_04410 [Candidatus Woesearchaeota archaeon]|nr:hypothetical protein QT06_C0001G0580 [archaeon GW2011_AR15]MBS3103891.1 hypothetical protein [Candidatus Woesearchaeota archaeon]HIH41632.1 hypothetical protein [Candidatus Woesearchaeota archaeon]